MVPIRLQVFAVLSFFASSSADGASFASMVRIKLAIPRGVQQATKLMIAQTSIFVFKIPDDLAGFGSSNWNVFAAEFSACPA